MKINNKAEKDLVLFLSGQPTNSAGCMGLSVVGFAVRFVPVVGKTAVLFGGVRPFTAT